MRFAASLKRPSTRAATSRFLSISAAGSLSRMCLTATFWPLPSRRGTRWSPVGTPRTSTFSQASTRAQRKIPIRTPRTSNDKCGRVSFVRGLLDGAAWVETADAASQLRQGEWHGPDRPGCLSADGAHFQVGTAQEYGPAPDRHDARGE